MQELAQAIVSNAQGPDGIDLDVAAKKWAAYSLDTYKDRLLEKALAISVALVNFTNELSNPGGD